MGRSDLRLHDLRHSGYTGRIMPAPRPPSDTNTQPPTVIVPSQPPSAAWGGP